MKPTDATDRAEGDIPSEELGQEIDVGDDQDGRRDRLSEPLTRLQLGGFVPRTQEPIMANARKATRQHMEEKSADKFFDRHRPLLLLIPIPIIAPTKGDLVVFEVKNARIRNRYPMGIASEVGEDSTGIGEGRLAVDHPLLSIERREPRRPMVSG